MKCDRCGFDNPDYLEYCQNCTAPLKKERAEDGKEPSWGFVNAPKWGNPDFSADTVSDDDIPADFINDRNARAAKTAAGAAVGAAASSIGEAVHRAKDKLGKKAKEYEREFDDEFADLDADLEDVDDRLDDFESDVHRGKKNVAAAIGDVFKKRHKEKVNYEDDFEDRPRISEDDVFGDDFEDDYDDNDEPVRAGDGRSLSRIIAIVGIIAALAVTAVAAWLIVKSAKGCSPKNKEYPAPVVEQGEEGTNCYYVTISAPEGTKLVYETTDGGRTPYTVPESCIAKFKVPVSGLMPGEPIDGAVYYAKPKVLVVKDDGTEEPISIDAVSIPVPSLGLTLDQESIVSDNGRATVSGHVDYVNAELTVDGEPVEVAADGTFRKDFEFEEVGERSIEVVAKLPNYQIARQNVAVTVNAPVEVDPGAVIQMPWEYDDNTFSQRIVNSLQAIDVRGRVPAGSSVTVGCESDNATLTTPTVDDDGTFHFTLTMAKPGDYTVTVNCTTPDGSQYSRDIHLQRQPDYRNYISGALNPDYSQFSYGSSQQYKLAGTVREIIQEGDYYLAMFEMKDGHTVVLEYHNHYGSAGTLEEGREYNEIYGRSKGFDESGNILFYVWFING